MSGDKRQTQGMGMIMQPPQVLPRLQNIALSSPAWECTLLGIVHSPLLVRVVPVDPRYKRLKAGGAKDLGSAGGFLAVRHPIYREFTEPSNVESIC